MNPFFFFFVSPGGWEKIKLKLTTLARNFICVVCRFNSIAFAIQRYLACSIDTYFFDQQVLIDRHNMLLLLQYVQVSLPGSAWEWRKNEIQASNI